MQTINLTTTEQIAALSYYTLCMLADAMMCVYPQHYIPAMIAKGHFVSVDVVVDENGNFISYKVNA